MYKIQYMIMIFLLLMPIGSLAEYEQLLNENESDYQEINEALKCMRNEQYQDGINKLHAIIQKTALVDRRKKALNTMCNFYEAQAYLKTGQIEKAESLLSNVLKETDNLTSYTSQGLPLKILIKVLSDVGLSECYSAKNQYSKSHSILAELHEFINNEIDLIDKKKNKSMEDEMILGWLKSKLPTLKSQLSDLEKH